MSARTAVKPPAPAGAGIHFVDTASPVTVAEALALLGTKAELHTLTFFGFAGGADMERAELEALIHAGAGGYRALPDSQPTIHGHSLALWSAHAEIPGGGYWVFVEPAPAARPALPPVLEVAGLRFARAPRRKVGTPLQPKPGFDGWFKPGAHGVLLLRPHGEPYVYASRNGGGFLVSTHLHDGRLRYLHSTTSSDEAALGISSYSDGIEKARSILAQAGVAPRF